MRDKGDDLIGGEAGGKGRIGEYRVREKTTVLRGEWLDVAETAWSE